MCFGSSMSSTTKDLTASTVLLANQMASQAGKIFGAADQTFNTISNSMTPILNAGPSQFGFSQGQFNAMNAAAVNSGGTEKRDLIAAAAASGKPFNAAAINQQVANQTATVENNIVSQGYQQGNANFFNAAGIEEKAPSVFSVATNADLAAMKGLQTATQAQENRDAAGGGWKNLVKAGIGIAGDIGGSFIGDPNLGNQIDNGLGASSGMGMNNGGNGGNGNIGTAAATLFGQNGTAWNNQPLEGPYQSAPWDPGTNVPTDTTDGISVDGYFNPNAGGQGPS